MNLEWPHRHNDSYHDIAMQKSWAFVTEISDKPEFYILTSLLWIRTENTSFDVVGEPAGDLEHAADSTLEPMKAPLAFQSDLGLLNLHRDRLAAAAESLGWRQLPQLDPSNDEESLETLRSSIALYLRCLPDLPKGYWERRKLRIRISKQGVISVDSSVMACEAISTSYFPPVFMPATLTLTGDETTTCRVLVDDLPTRPSTFTTHKTSYRQHYDEARARAGITKHSPLEKEVLLYNPHGEIIEASLCTVYFNRDGVWFTPAATCGAMLGVTRRMALEKSLCQQGLLEFTQLKEGEMIWLSNAARGFFLGKISLAKLPSQKERVREV